MQILATKERVCHRHYEVHTRTELFLELWSGMHFQWTRTEGRDGTSSL